jgi:hypothetical protein
MATKFTIGFICNGYTATIETDDVSGLEMDIVEARTALMNLPAAVTIRSGYDPQPVGESASTKKSDSDETVSPDWEVVPVTSIKEETAKAGGKLFKCFGGKYETWGVALWPDTCDFKDGLIPSMLMNSVVSGLEMLVVVQGGKRRVAKIRRRVATHG